MQRQSKEKDTDKEFKEQWQFTEESIKKAKKVHELMKKAKKTADKAKNSDAYKEDIEKEREKTHSANARRKKAESQLQKTQEANQNMLKQLLKMSLQLGSSTKTPESETIKNFAKMNNLSLSEVKGMTKGISKV